jgi:hypothetical protein
VAPALTSQIHAPVRDEPTPHEACNFETRIVEGGSTREDLLPGALQPNEAQETAQTPSDDELERMVEAHKERFNAISMK